jgi:putative Mg2+ transporter-C (MgtC) family protein
LPVLTSVLCGGMIGLERQLRGKPLDVRSGVLICLGTHVFIRLSLTASAHATGNIDPTRVLGQVVTGIGFLGAGVMLTRGKHVVGVTTASVIWVLAAIGASIGFSNYAGALALALVTLAVLTILEVVENRVAAHASRRARERKQRRRSRARLSLSASLLSRRLPSAAVSSVAVHETRPPRRGA